MWALSATDSSVSQYISRLNSSLTTVREACLFRSNGKRQEQKTFVCTVGRHWVTDPEAPLGPSERSVPSFLSLANTSNFHLAGIIRSQSLCPKTFYYLIEKGVRKDWSAFVLLVFCYSNISMFIVVERLLSFLSYPVIIKILWQTCPLVF